MIACGSANGSVHLMEVSENMTCSAKNDKAILNAVSRTLQGTMKFPFIFCFRFLPSLMTHLKIPSRVCDATSSDSTSFSFLLLCFTRQMLDRESKREKILEGKLREIKIKLKKQMEQQEARAAALLAREAEKAAVEEIKAQEAVPRVKPSLSQRNNNDSLNSSDERASFNLISVLIETAETEFNQMIDEELQRRIKEQEQHEQHEKHKKSPKVQKKKDEAPLNTEQAPAVNGAQSGTHVNGTANGNHHGSDHDDPGSVPEHEEQTTEEQLE